MLFIRSLFYLTILTLFTHGNVQGAPPWAPAHQFALENGYEVNLAADASGHAMAIWTDNNGESISTSYFTGGAWGPSTPISTVGVGIKALSDIAMDATGTALAVWQESGVEIGTATFNGTTWDPPTTLFTGSASFAKVAMDGLGNGIASWVDSTNQLYAVLYNGTSWGANQILQTGMSNNDVAISSNGTAIVLGTDFSTIYANFYDGSVFQAPVQISSGAGNSLPQIGMTSTGTAHVVWAEGGDILTAFFNGATWSLPSAISTGLGNSSPSIAVQPDGLATAVWTGNSGTTIQSASFNGTSWSTPTIITTSALVVGPSVAMDGNGNAITTWLFYEVGNYQIQSALLRATQGTTWDAPLIVNVSTDSSEVTVAAFSASGRAFTIWDSLGDNNLPFGSFYDPFASPVPAPLNFRGVSCNDYFAWQKDCLHILSWAPPVSPDVASFRLRRNGTLIAQLPATGPYTYVDHNRCRQTDLYALTSVDALGEESTPVFVVLGQ